MNAIVPGMDALPLPGPLWLFENLLHLTFVLHLLAMNFLLGGAILAFIDRMQGGVRELGEASIARWIERKLPITMAATVTLGVAPLLFVQAIYGNLFYASSVLMAWPWFSVIGVLLVTYSLTYVLSYRGANLGGMGRVLGALIGLGLLTVAFLYVNNMTLAIRPESWASKYFSRPGGTSLNVDDPTFWPRLLHFVIAAVAVAGLVIATVGAKRLKGGPDREARRWVQTGALWFVIPTALQIGVGLWWLITLPREVMTPLMGGSGHATGVFILSITLPIFAIILAALSIKIERPFGALHGVGWMLVLTIYGMVMTRQVVREGMLASHFDAGTIVTEPQWDLFWIFAVLLVVAIATIVWMLRQMKR